MLLTLLLWAHTSLDVGAADVNAILASAAAASDNIYGTGQCAAPRVTGAAARDCRGQPCHLVMPCFVRDTTAAGEAQSPGIAAKRAAGKVAPIPSLLPAADRDALSLIGLGAAKTLVYALHYVFSSQTLRSEGRGRTPNRPRNAYLNLGVWPALLDLLILEDQTSKSEILKLCRC